MSDKTKVEFIIVGQNVFKSVISNASAFALFSSLIGVGVFVGSSAMQWCGFLIGVLFLVARSAKSTKRMTREEAIKYLQSGRDEP